MNYIDFGYHTTKWNWTYGRWLVELRQCLVSMIDPKVGHLFPNGVYPDPKQWFHYYECGYSPYKAAREDTGYPPTIFYRHYNCKTLIFNSDSEYIKPNKYHVDLR